MAEQVLSNIRVLDLTHHIAGPYCTKLLADYGAEVIKVERPGSGDPARALGPFPADEPHPERSGIFLHLNTNKLGITLNLKTPTGVAILKRLAQDADIVVENFRPGALASLGLSYAVLAQGNPRLVLTHISNFGQTGPYRDYKATELTAFALGSRMSLMGEADKPPVRYAGNVVQYLAGTKAAAATMVAFFGALVHGIGQEVDVSIQEVLLSGVDNRLVFYDYTKEIPHRSDSAGAGYVTCADGHVQFPVAAIQTRQWNRLVQLLGRPELKEDPRFLTPALRTQHRGDIEAIVRPWLMTQNKRDITTAAQAVGVFAGPVLDIGEVLEDPHHSERGYFVEIEHPVAGRLRYPGGAFKMQEGGWEVRCPAPLLGQHNQEIYCGRLGYSQADLVRLRALEVI